MPERAAYLYIVDGFADWEPAQPSAVAIMILPGGDFWLNSPIDPVLESTLKLFDRENIPLAAICASTTAIARIGILHGRRHTSNSLEFLQKEVPTYSEASNYVNQPAVRDRGLITASGLGDVEFAKEIVFHRRSVLPAVWLQDFSRPEVCCVCAYRTARYRLKD